MNVLIFVMTMMMLLSLMTYARLESYRSSQTFQTIFKHYMEEEERGYINIQAKKAYDGIKVSEKKGKKSTKSEASPRIGIGLFFDKKRDSKPNEWGQTKILFKNLINTLYDKQAFYVEMQQERPAFVDELIKGIVEAVDRLPDEKKFNAAADLANLKLDDLELDRVLYKMLHGALYTNTTTEKTEKIRPKTGKVAEVEPEASTDDEDLSEEAAEFTSPEGYYSLLDFVTFSSNPKIRIYLASKEVLRSIFPDPATVESIIEERERLYHQILNDEDSSNSKELEEKFKTLFIKLKAPSIEDATLNFSISKTNPKYYR